MPEHTRHNVKRIEKLENVALVAFLAATIVIIGSTPEGKIALQQLVKLIAFAGAVCVGIRSYFD